MVRSLLALALVAISSFGVSAVSARGLPNGTPVSVQYLYPNKATVYDTGSSGPVPHTENKLDAALTTGKSVNALLTTVKKNEITILSTGAAGPFVDGQSFNGVAISIVRSCGECFKVSLCSLTRDPKLSTTASPHVDFDASNLSVSPNGQTLYVDFSGYTLQKNTKVGIMVDTYRCYPPQPSSSSSTGGFVESSTLPPPVTESSTGGLDQSSTLPPPVTESSTGTIVTDPQFTGFLGQSYQVHGTAETDYSIISSEALQYNAHFVFLTEGKCRAGTECYSHPGNYFGQVGILVKQKDGSIAKLKVESGDVEKGLTVTIDGEPLTPSAKTLTMDDQNSLSFPNQFELLLQTRDWTIRLMNSDKFLNQQIEIRQPLLEQVRLFKSSSSTSAAETLPHGVLGQTWRLMKYPNRWQYIEGDLMNYVIQDVMATPQQYNRFNL